MAGLEELVENRRTGSVEGSEYEFRIEEASIRSKTTERTRPRVRWQTPPPSPSTKYRQTENESFRRNTPPQAESQGARLQTPYLSPQLSHTVYNERMHESWRQGGPPAQEDYRAQFYDKYWKVAEEHDKKFLKKYDLDFNTTLIFAGLLSAVTSAFIIQVNSQLQPNSGVETTALLRSFIHKIDNTMFGNVSTPPQWGGPSWATVLAQIFLVISLAASLFSAFLAVLGKQWLSCYESIDLRETVIERGQNRQQKLDGLVTWRFHRVMESLPLMLQVALFFLGYAVPLSLMDNSTMISFVALGLTSFGVLLHFSVVIAGAVFKNCPYQTSASYLLRHLRPKSPSIVHSLEVSNKLAVTPPNRSITMVEPERVDLQCVSWILWTSPDKTLHLSTLLYLASISTLDGVDPTLVLNCFYIFASCTSLRDQRVAIMQGSEQLAAVSAKCLSRCWEHHVSTTNPRISRVLEDLRRRYTRVFPINTDFGGLPFGAMIVRIHSLSHQVRNIWKSNSEPALQAYTGSPSWPIRYSRQLLEDAQEGYRMTQNKKVPRRILWSALRSLSLDPPDSAFDVAHYLMVIAIDLDLDILTIVALDASGCVEQVSSLITRKLETMVGANDPALIFSKRKAISALVPYAVFLDRGAQQGMVNLISLAAAASKSEEFIWRHVEANIGVLFDEPSPPSLNLIIVLASSVMRWDQLNGRREVTRWAEAVSAVPYTEQVGSSVAEVLLRIVANDSLREHIPANAWALLKNRPTLRLGCEAQSMGTVGDIVRHVRGLGDIEILKSYFLLVWSEWDFPHPSGQDEMEVSIHQDFGGPDMKSHRQELIERLDHILGQLDRELEHFHRHEKLVHEQQILWAKEDYGELRKALLEMHTRSEESP